VVVGLTANVSDDLIDLRNTHAKGPVAVLPLKREAAFVQESRGVCFKDVDCGCQRDRCRQEEEKMAMVRHSSRSKKRNFMLTRNRCNERLEPFLKFRRDQILSILGAIDHVNIIVGIRMAHTRGQRFRAE